MFNVNKVYGVGMGVTLLGVFSTEEKARDWMEANIEPVVKGSEWDGEGWVLTYHYPYILTLEPGTIQASEVHAGFGYLRLNDNKDESNTHIFDYVNIRNIEVGNLATARAKFN